MISLLGLGPDRPDAMSLAARDVLRAASCIIVRTERHPAIEMLRQEAIPYQSCDDLYEALPTFDDVYRAIADRVIGVAGAQDVVYAVPGHPMIGEATVRIIRDMAREAGITTRIVGSASFVESCLAAAGAALDEGLLVADALSLHKSDLPCDLPILIYQVYDPQSASAAKLALMRRRSAEQPVIVIRGSAAPENTAETIPLYRLDRVPIDHLTAVYVPPADPAMCRQGYDDLVRVMARLRGEDGCPWDREQDHRSLRKWLVEECYEAIECIDAEDWDGLCEELGDVLLQVVFHAQIADEKGFFDAVDVTHGIVEKLIRRHPHVFGDRVADTPAAVVQNWEAIKREEKGERESALDGVPSGLPALHRAEKLGQRAAKLGFDWERIEDVLAKVDEEVAELRAAIGAGDSTAIHHEIGDVLFAIVNVARWTDVEPEEALRDMLCRFSARFRAIEVEAARSGRRLADLSLAEMDAIWDAAKESEA